MANSRAASKTKRPVRSAGADYVDSGQPVEDLPPLEEFGFDEPVKAEMPAKAERVKAEMPAKDEPPAPAPATSRKKQAASDPVPSPGDGPLPKFFARMDRRAEAPPLSGAEAAEPIAGKTKLGGLERWRPAAQKWRSAAASIVPADRKQRTAIGAGAVAVLVIVAAVAGGLGPFSRITNYRSGQPPSDPAKRFAYYQAGAKTGDSDAELQVAILYAKGEGVPQDYAAAATWFRAAADQGVARAQYDLGVLYERGRGVQVDLAQAANWYLKAAAGRFPLAEYNLAVCYTKGQGIRQDLPEAALWYRRAAGHGVVQAMVNLGTMYEKGDGIGASPVDAYAWYLAAGQRGSQSATQRAQDLFTSLPRLDQIRAEALASDVAASIKTPEAERGDAAMEKTDANSVTPDH